MTEGLTTCPKCKYKKALTCWVSSGFINWIACPKCRTFFDHDKEKPDAKHEYGFWEHVESDTGYNER